LISSQLYPPIGVPRSVFQDPTYRSFSRGDHGIGSDGEASDRRGRQRQSRCRLCRSAFPDKGTLSGSDLDKAVKDLFATGAFSDIKVDRKGSRYVVTVSETPVVVNVLFTGNKRLKDEQIAQKAGLDGGSAFAPARLVEIDRRIEAAYAATGRRNARVTHEVVERPGGFYDVSFKIDEGTRSETSDIWFEGNGSFSDIKLRSVISTKRTGLFTKLLSRDVLDTDRLEADRQRLEAFYKSRGFSDVTVSEAEVDFDAEGDNAMAGFRIVEGPRYSVASVSLENSTGAEIPASALASAREMEGMTYDEGRTSDTADRLAKLMEDEGVFPVEVKSRPNRQANGTIDVSYTIDRAQKVYVERIEIVGNEVTKDYVIRREIDLAEGDLFNPRLVREAERRMRRLGFFDDVRILSTRGSGDDRVVIKVEVKERKTGAFEIGAAYSQTDGPMAILSISQSNFGGTGRAISASVGQGTETSNYDLSFTEPYLFGNRLSGTAQVFRRGYDAKDGGFRPYDETVEGARISVKGPLSANADLTVYYSFLNSSKSEMEIDIQPLLSDAERIVSSIGYDWSYADLDDDQEPSDGFKLGFGQQFAGVGGDAAFVRTEASARVYRELSRRHEVIGSVSVRAGHVAGLAEDLSFEDHFRSVADFVRGFESGGFGPRDLDTGYLLGGQYYAGASAEAVYPIPILSDGLGIKGSVFADLGSIWGADAARVGSTGASALYDSASLRASIGTGVIWDSPLGLFKANFAVPLAREAEDRTQVFSISGGTRF
jgi:outer membrane protein insertion porin family